MKETEGVEIHQGMEVGVVKPILILVDAVVAHHLREQVEVEVFLIELWVELVALKKV